jgi:predicted acylesterase/phospholipase RssA
MICFGRMSIPVNENKRALVISGGGAYGAWGGGVLEHITNNGERRYDQIVGTSTGSLMAPLVALGDYERLQRAYTNVTQEDIFNVNPFNTDGEPKVAKILWRMTWGYRTVGESAPLRRLIKNFLKPQDFEKLRTEQPGLELVVTCYNMSEGRVEFKNINDPTLPYEQAVDWIWASANSPLFMSIAEIGGQDYTDGGVAEHTPVRYFFQPGGDRQPEWPGALDLIIHRQQHKHPTGAYNNVVRNLLYIIDALKIEVSKSDIRYVDDLVRERPTEFRAYFMSFAPSFPPLQFRPSKMQALWQRGRQGDYEIWPERGGR